jgi:transcriptional regulator with XRE-family HTH domain
MRRKSQGYSAFAVVSYLDLKPKYPQPRPADQGMYDFLRSGWTRAMISRLENGWNLNPAVETLFRYAEALGVGLKLVLDESAQRATDD